jgi:EmrB/QacA subfamily drug resistance transporter
VRHRREWAEGSTYLHGRRRTLVIFAGVLLALFLAAIQQHIAATILPRIVGDLGGFGQYAWIFSGYMLGMAASAPLAGKLSDIYGRRPVFSAGIVAMMGGALLCGTATTMEQLIAGRLVQGIGAGSLVPVGMALIADLVAPRELGRWQAYTGVGFGVSSIIGPSTGGWIADVASWRLAFFATLPLALTALTVVLLGFRVRPARAERSVDYAGSALLTAALAMTLSIAVYGGGTWAWSSAQVAALAAGAVVCLLAFVRVELRAVAPIIPLRSFRNRTFASTHVAGLMMGAAIFGPVAYVPLFAQGVMGVSAGRSGLIVTPLLLATIFGGLASGYIVSLTGRYDHVLPLGFGAIGLGWFLLSRLGIGSSATAAALSASVIGLGMGLSSQTLILVIQNTSTRAELGSATSTMHLFRTLGGALMVSLMGGIVGSQVHNAIGGAAADKSVAALVGSTKHLAAGDLALRSTLEHAMRLAFELGIPIALLGLVATLLIENRELHRTIHRGAPPVAATTTTVEKES